MWVGNQNKDNFGINDVKQNSGNRTIVVRVASSVERIGGMLCHLVAVGLVHGCHQN